MNSLRPTVYMDTCAIFLVFLFPSPYEILVAAFTRGSDAERETDWSKVRFDYSAIALQHQILLVLAYYAIYQSKEMFLALPAAHPS